MAKPRFRKLFFSEGPIVVALALLGFLVAFWLFSDPEGGAMPGGRWLIYLVAVLAVAALAAVASAVRVSRRISGPADRIRAALDEIRKGRDPGNISIREDDDLHELVTTLNAALEQIRASGPVLTTNAPHVDVDVLRAVSEGLDKRSGAPGRGVWAADAIEPRGPVAQ